MQRHEARVFATALQYLGSTADAEDASQEVFLRVFRAVARFEKKSAFSTWLYRIVQNVCATRFTKRKTRTARRVRMAEGGAFAPQHDPRADLDDRLSGMDPDVRAALDALSAGDKEAIVLRFVAELSVGQVAETLGLKESATKMKLMRAKERFAAHLAAQRAATKAKESR